MGNFGQFQSEDHAARFFRASALQRFGSDARPICGARTANGKLCGQTPIREGKGRCLRHCGAIAARAHRETQLRQMETGKITPEVFAQAEARRARNRLSQRWKKNPSLPGRTIDLGVSEGAFLDAARALGADAGLLLPAVRDWLAWRYQRTQVDRRADTAWTRAVHIDLPNRIADADAAMVWVRLGGLDKRTKEGRALMAALRTGGEEKAAALTHKAGTNGIWAISEDSAPATKAWVSVNALAPSKRVIADRLKSGRKLKPYRPKPLGRPRKRLDTPDEMAALMKVYWAADRSVQDMFLAIVGDADRLTFLRALKGVVDAPNDASAQRRWSVWVANFIHV